MIGAFQSVYRFKVCTCIVEYIEQYCESKSVCCLSVDVVDESFVGCGKLNERFIRVCSKLVNQLSSTICW